MPDFFVHETSFIDDGVKIGNGTKIWHFCHIMTGSVIGEKCNLGQNVTVGPNTKIGNRCKIQNNVSVYTDVEIEDDVFCGPSMVFTNVINPRAFIERKHEYRKTLLKKGCTVGANATIVCGNSVGRYAMIASGAVVVKNVPDYGLYAGVPAKSIGWVCKCGVTLKDFSLEQAECSACGNIYRLENEILVPVKES
jgi:UDP-2-acetamido-3-amino-2,3-dideoxy-glucuronate N-acetyltransferase